MRESVRTNSNLNVILLFVMIFIVNCFLAWFIFTIYLFLSRDCKNKSVLLWSILSIVFVSLFNATKIPENDLSWYVDYYLAAGSMSLKNYLTMLTGGKEQLYQFLVYALHFIGGNNYHVYIFSVSILSYSCLLRTLFIIKNEMSVSNRKFLLVVGFLCFFPYTFAISVHIVRQVLASSLVIWLLFEYYCGKKQRFLKILAISTVFIHSSAIFILPFFFIKQIVRPIDKRSIWVYVSICVAIFSISYIGGEVLSIATGDSVAGYIAGKMANGTTFDTSLPLSQLLLSIAFVAIGYKSIYFHSKQFKNNIAPLLILHVSTILLIFILANSSNPELQLRCNFFFWTYASLFMAVIFACYNISQYLTLLLFGALFFFWNFYNSNMSQWTYTCRSDYYLYPIFQYFYN